MGKSRPTTRMPRRVRGRIPEHPRGVRRDQCGRIAGSRPSRDRPLRGVSPQEMRPSARRFYPATADPLPDGTVYSLPEFDAASGPGARLISCPGCYPDRRLLSLLPLARAGLLAGRRHRRRQVGHLRAPARRRASGRTSPRTTAASRPTALFGHRHTPEMEQALGAPVTFVPHLVPLDRGILVDDLRRGSVPGTTAAQVADAIRARLRDGAVRAPDRRPAARDQARRRTRTSATSAGRWMSRPAALIVVACSTTWSRAPPARRSRTSTCCAASTKRTGLL